MTKRFLVGIAGAGIFGGHHASKFADHPLTELAGIYDIDPVRAAALADKHNAPSFTDYSEFLKHLDGVVIAAPASAHYLLARAALLEGLNVFVEKPITLDVDEADDLIAIATRRGRILQVGHQERYVAGAAGLFNRTKPIRRIECVRRTKASGRCEDVSVALDLMVHDLDLVRKLTKAEIAAIEAKGDRHDISATLVLDNGAEVTLEASRRAEEIDRRMTVYYDDGDVTFDFIARRLTDSADPAGVQDQPYSPVFDDPLGFGARQFVQSLIDGRTPIVSGRDGRQALAWARRIEAAAGVDHAIVEGEPTRERLRA